MGRRWFSRRGSPWILANSQARGFASKEKESKRLHKKTVRKCVRETKSTDPPTARASKIVSLLTQPPCPAPAWQAKRLSAPIQTPLGT